MADITITDVNFEEEILNSDKMVLVDFWADWCGPCKMQAPILDEIAAEYPDQVKIAKVNVDEQPEIAAAFQVTGIPKLVVFDKGQILASAVGLQSKSALKRLLKL